MSNPYRAAEEFMRDFRCAEYALKRSGFRRIGREVAEADWDLFAQYLGGPFFKQIVDAGIAKTLIGVPSRRLLADMTWSPEHPIPLSNIAQLMINGVCRVRNSYIHKSSPGGRGTI